MRHSYTSIVTRSPPCRDFIRHGRYVMATIAASQSPPSYSTATISARQSQRCVQDRLDTVPQSPQPVLGRHDEGISLTTADTRSPQLEQSERHGRYSNATIAAFQSPPQTLDRHNWSNPNATAYTWRSRLRHLNRHGRNLIATTTASQALRQILERYSCSISMTKSQILSSRYDHSYRGEPYTRNLLFLALVRRPSIARPTRCRSVAPH